MRRNIVAAVEPMKKQVQSNALAIPSKGHGSTGLRASIAEATKVKVTAGARVSRVRLQVDAAKMPVGQGALPRLMEGERKWRHPVYGGPWVPQDAHPYFAKAVAQHLPGVQAGVLKAVDQTAAELSRG